MQFKAIAILVSVAAVAIAAPRANALPELIPIKRNPERTSFFPSELER